MNHRKQTRRISRRTALQRMTAGVAGAVSLSTLFGTSPAHGASRVNWKTPSGAEIWQLTSKSFSQANIYCEHSYCSADSRYFVYQGQNQSKADGENPTEYSVMELGAWQRHRLDEGAGRPGLAISRDGVLYYMKHYANDDGLYLMRANLSEGKPEKVHRMKTPPWTIGSVSSDHRYYICGKLLDGEVENGNQVFGILAIDLEKDEELIIDRGTDIFNSHPQFAPEGHNQVLIQHNRGGGARPGGHTAAQGVYRYKSSGGPEGATLFLLSVPDGKRTLLQIGKPYTERITGHETWIDPTREIMASVFWSGDYAASKGNLLAVREGVPARRVAKGYQFNHLHVSRCGRVFLADDWQPPHRQVIGSIKTGKTQVLFEAYDTPRSMPKPAHAHTYLSRDLKWAIFNCDRTGPILLYAARVPDELLNDLLKT